MSSAPPFDLIIFDLDGTLVDSLPDIAWALNATLVEAGLPALTLDTVARFVGDGAAKLLDRALAEVATSSATERPPQLLSRFMGHYAGHLCVDSRLYPGVPELLDRLTAQGIAAAVVTNKPGDLARTLLGTLGVATRVAAILGDLDGFPRKPDPAAARSIIGRLGVPSGRVAVIGDGIPDVRLARAVPCRALAAAWGYVPAQRLQAEGPDALLASVKDAAAMLLPHADA